MEPDTPYYLIDEKKLLKNMERIARVRESSGAKSVLALKCFSVPAVFGLMSRYMSGTTSSSLYEARLGHEEFPGEVHAYSVAWSDDEIDRVKEIATKVIFNSVSQLRRFAPRLKGLPTGLRINPGISHSDFDLADPARRYSRLGASDMDEIGSAAGLINGVMFHCNCENADFSSFSSYLDSVSARYAGLLEKMEWVSLGGGIFFTKDGYPLEDFCGKLKGFSERFKVQVYLEPGETAITAAGFLVTKVLDIVHNEMDIAIVDSSVEAHMLDLLIYRQDARIEGAPASGKKYMVAGRSCLAGDVFGIFNFKEELQIGTIIHIADAAGYTMVKKNWFNGLRMPSIFIKRLDGSLEEAKRFSYRDYRLSMTKENK